MGYPTYYCALILWFDHFVNGFLENLKKSKTFWPLNGTLEWFFLHELLFYKFEFIICMLLRFLLGWNHAKVKNRQMSCAWTPSRSHCTQYIYFIFIFLNAAVLVRAIYTALVLVLITDSSIIKRTFMLSNAEQVFGSNTKRVHVWSWFVIQDYFRK